MLGYLFYYLYLFIVLYVVIRVCYSLKDEIKSIYVDVFKSIYVVLFKKGNEKNIEYKKEENEK